MGDCGLDNIPPQGHNHGRKVEGDLGLGPNTGDLAPRARPKARLGVGCGRGLPPPAVRVRGYYPRKIFEISDAKSCILVTTCCKISCFLKTTAKKLGDQYIVFSQPKSWGPVSPDPYGYCAYVPPPSQLTCLIIFHNRPTT